MIEKILHFVWIGEHKIPNTINTWIDKHPEWTTYIWNEKKISKLKLINSEIYELDNKKYNQKSDVVRLEILYRYGGVYIDADIICNKSIDNLLNNTLFFTQEKKGLVSNSFIGCKKKNRIILELIKHIKVNFDPNLAVWKNTGPGIVTKFLLDKKLIGIDRTKYNMRSVGRCKVYPYFYVNIMCDQIRKCIFNPIGDKIDIKRDIRYTLNNTIDYNNIYGVQLWMGGRASNYTRVLNLELISNNINKYIRVLQNEDKSHTSENIKLFT